MASMEHTLKSISHSTFTCYKKKTLKIKCFTVELIRLNHINFFITENKLGIKKFLIYKMTNCNCWGITKVFYIEYIYQIVSVIIWRVS